MYKTRYKINPLFIGEKILRKNWSQNNLSVVVPHNVEIITPSSPMPIKKSLQEIALYFKREFGYDFIQFIANDKTDYKAFAFTEPFYARDQGKLIVGGCCFRFREYDDHPHGWSLQWIWLHPFLRNQGTLSSVWPFLKKMVGDFWCEPPFSDAMKRFLKKNNEWDKYEISGAEDGGNERI